MKLSSAITICLLLFINCKQPDKEINIVYPTGGSFYQKNISKRDSNHYFLPEKHKIPDRDSFLAYDEKYFFQGFDEENLSLSPPKKDIFRFTFKGGLGGKAAIVKLSETEIIIKKNKYGYPGLNIDEERLTALGKEHFYMIERYYPFDNPKHSVTYRKFFDSILKIYPQLNDRSYYDSLRNKASVIYQMSDKYSEQRISISSRQFKYFVDKLNSSGFWERSFGNDCATAPMDGDGFIVEASTTEKYHFVDHDYCQGDDEKGDLRKMINELLSFIHFDLRAFYEEDIPKRKKDIDK